jgi:hypothetical protein
MKKLVISLICILLVSTSFGQASIKIRAFIDGRDQIIIKGSTIQWLHYTYAAPGRLSLQKLPTYLNDVAWYPDWPDIPNAENRQKCYSSVYSDLIPALPSSAEFYYLTKISGTGGMFIAQQPRDTNKYTLIIEFDDYLPGAQWYETTIESKSTYNDDINVALEDDLVIYPNPTSGVINFFLPYNKKNNCVKIFNSNGKVLKSVEFSQGTINAKLDISEYLPGIYFLKIDTDDKTDCRKIIKY